MIRDSHLHRRNVAGPRRVLEFGRGQQLLAIILVISIGWLTLAVSNSSRGANLRIIRLHDPTSLAVGNHNLWVTEWAPDRVVQIGRRSGLLVRTFRGGSAISAPRSAILVGSELWVANDGNNSISIFDASSGQLLRKLSSAGRFLDDPIQMLLTGGRVIVLNVRSDCLSELDITTGSLVAKVSLGSYSSTPTDIFGPLEMVASGENVWITYTSKRYETLMKVNLLSDKIETQKTVNQYRSNDGFGQLALGEGKLFVTIDGYRDVGVYSTSNLHPLARISGKQIGLVSVAGLASTGGDLWIVDRSSGTVDVVSGTTHLVLSVVHVANPNDSILSSMQISGGSAWIIDQLGAVYRVSTAMGHELREY